MSEAASAEQLGTAGGFGFCEGVGEGLEVGDGFELVAVGVGVAAVGAEREALLEAVAEEG